MSRMALEKDVFKRFSVIQEFSVTGNRSLNSCIKGENGPLRLSVYSDNILILLWESRLRRSLP